MKKAVIMARVSTDEQASGYSLDSQIDQLKRYCEQRDIEIAYEFREEHSAKTFERPEFNKFLKLAKANKGMFDYFLFISWDRFSRNTTDSFLMIRTMQKLGIEAQATTQPIDFKIPESKFMLAYYLTFPEVDNDRRSIKIKDGIRMALLSGRWVAGAPKGYLNSRDSSNKPLLISNPKLAPVVKLMFELALTEMTHCQIRAEVKSHGLVYSRNGISVALRNPIYIGKIIVQPNENELTARLIDAIHEPLISEELFYKVQDKLNVKVNRRKAARNKTMRPELPLRGIMKCSKCSNLLTGSGSRSKTGAYHFYYHCNKCHNERIPATKLNHEIDQVFELFTFKKNPTELYNVILSNYLNEDEKTSASEKQKAKKALDLIEKRLESLQFLLLDGQVEVSEYQILKSKLVSEATNLKLISLPKDARRKELKEKLKSSINMLKNLPSAMISMGVEERHMVLSSIFPEKLEFDGKNCRTPKMNQVFSLLLTVDKGSSGQEKRDKLQNLGLSLGVEPAGVEPASKQGIHKPSTCLFPNQLSEVGRNGTNQPSS
jgi:site-specific DNA recombinase